MRTWEQMMNDLKEMDLKWQVAMISMRMKKFYKKTGRKLQFDAKEPVGFDKTKVECYNCHKIGHFARECRIKGTQDNRRRDAWNSGNKDGSRTGQKEDSKALVTIDGEGVDWTNHSEDEDYALMACKHLDQDTSVIVLYKGIILRARPPMSEVVKENAECGCHRPDVEIDYWIKLHMVQNKLERDPSESESQSSEFDTCESNISAEPSELVSEPVVNESNVECQPKVWSDAPIIEEYESDSEDECVSIPTKQQETPSFANKQVKTPRETVKNQFTHSQKPKVDKTELGYGFTVRACFVCGSLNHLIRDCDFHEKRMARKAELNNGWNNVQRVNKQNQFVPSAVLTRTGKIPVNTARASGTKNVSTARQNFNRQTVLTSTAMKVNTVKPIVNRVRPANVFYKTHSPSSRPFKKTTVLRTDFSKQKVNTAKGILKKRMNLLKTALYCPYGLLVLQQSLLYSKQMIREKVQERKNKSLWMNLKELKRQNRKLMRKLKLSEEVEQETENLGLSLSDPTNPEEDDSEIPLLEDIYQNSSDGIFTTSSYDMRVLVDLPYGNKAIGTKWVYRNKKDERGVIVRNKARLVAQGHRQEEGIDYDEVFAHVARIEAIRIFLAFASYMGFIVYQMNVKSAFLYGKIDEEEYMYLNHQNGYRRGTIDKILFIKKDKHDIILVQVYVDDIIFGSTKKSWCDEFEALMKSKFQMSSMGETTHFLSWITTSTPIKDSEALVNDEEASDVDVHTPIVCACSRVSSFDLESYSDSDYAGANLNRKSTTGGCQFLGRRLISWQCKKQTIVATSLQKQIICSYAEAVVGSLCLAPKTYINPSVNASSLRNLSKLHSYLQALISLLTTITLSTPMAVLDSCPKHNMVAYLEKSEGNAEFFHEIIRFFLNRQFHFISLTDEGAPSERPSEAQPTPSPTPISEVPNEPQTDSSPAQTSERAAEYLTRRKLVLIYKSLVTRRSKVSTDRQIEGTDEQNEGTEEQIESTDGQRKEEWEGEEERNRIAEEKATNEALIRNFDDIKARIEADRLLAKKLQEQER
ncbi:ribonuclease H-like domain-containing protein [Tanacetum coccineum]